MTEGIDGEKAKVYSDAHPPHQISKIFVGVWCPGSIERHNGTHKPSKSRNYIPSLVLQTWMISDEIEWSDKPRSAELTF